MAIKIEKPTSNARRKMSYVIFDIDKKKPAKKLTFGKSRISGRNNSGRITVRNRGTGAKRLLRVINTKQNGNDQKKLEVISIEYDPNRSANIALVKDESGNLSYILAANKLKKGATISCGEGSAIRVGNRLKLKDIPSSTQVFNIEINQGRGGQISRSAGSYAILLGTDNNYAQIKLPSGEVRKVSKECYATIGVASNVDHSKEMIGKAGRKRLFGKRPHVRGKAKNPVDHPHGGGEGGTGIGLKYPKTPWGMPALGHKTRKIHKKSSILIIEKRKK